MNTRTKVDKGSLMWTGWMPIAVGIVVTLVAVNIEPTVTNSGWLGQVLLVAITFSGVALALGLLVIGVSGALREVSVTPTENDN